MTISIFGTGVIDSEDARISLANTALVIPTGNTLQRPSSAVSGMIRFNTQTTRYEAYNGNVWANISSPYIAPFALDYLVIAGGGAGGSDGGGGGAGGYRTGNLTVTTGNVYSITVGAGGSRSIPAAGNPGSSSIFSTITSAGGGGGGGPDNGLSGGSGGGGGYGSVGVGTSGGSGNTPPTSPPQGNPGGTGIWLSNAQRFGGGGGAGAAGENYDTDGSNQGGDGGDGSPSLITGANVVYAGGGGGGAVTGTAGTGGNGGGGAGATGSNQATAGTTNTGGGGGGSASFSAGGGNGGSGIVVLAHANTLPSATITAGLTYTTNTTSRPGFIVYRFTAGTGTISWS